MSQEHIFSIFLLLGFSLTFGQMAFAEISASSQPATTPASRTPASQPAGNTLPKELILDLGNGVKMELVLIPAGEFMMGSSEKEQDQAQVEFEVWKKKANSPRDWSGRVEGPQHQVTIARPFYMGKYDVTVVQFRRFVQDSGYKTDAEKAGDAWAMDWSAGKWGEVKGITWSNPGFPQEDNHPVVYVSWNDAQAFCAWASHKTGQKVTLPSEAQWEYVARSGDGRLFSWGNEWPPRPGAGNYADESLGEEFQHRTGKPWGIEGYRDGHAFTSPVGSFRANPFGVYDIGSNVWLWCQDVYHDSYAGAPTDGTAWEGNGIKHVLRGSSWWNDLRWVLRLAFRGMNPPDYRCDHDGFRVVMGSSGTP